jgi:hypothetical protein
MNGTFSLGSSLPRYVGFKIEYTRGNHIMIRYTFFVLTVLGSAATAIAAITPASDMPLPNAKNVTVIEMNQAFPVYGPIVVEQCAVENCSDVKA